MLPTRAGLVALFLALYFALGQCSPIPVTSMYHSRTTLDDLGLSTAQTHDAHRMTHCTTNAPSVQYVRFNIINPAPENLLPSIAIVPTTLARRAAEFDEVVTLVRRKSLGQKIRDAFHHLGQRIKHGFERMGHAIKKGFEHVGHAIKTAAHKVGHFFKETGKKIAKVALKVAAIATKAVSKVIGFIPGVGKLAGKALDAGSKGLNKASDAIHCKIGGKLGQAMHRMDKGIHVMNYIP